MKRLILAMLIALPSWGALASGVVWEERNGGADTNGGGFIAGASGTDRSQSATAFCSGTDLVLVTTSTGTSVSCPFSAASVGNIIQITAGTNCTAGFYQVVSVSTVTATFDRVAGTLACVAGTFSLGGAIKTCQVLNTALATSNVTQTAWVRADSTYTPTADCIFNFTSNGNVQINGYTSTRGDGGYVTIQATGSGINNLWDLQVGGNEQSISRNLILDCNTKSGCRAARQFTASQTLENVKLINWTAPGGLLMNNVWETCRFCLFTGGSSSGVALNAGNNGENCFACVIEGNTGTGSYISGGGQLSCAWCVVANNTSSSTPPAVLIGNNGAGPWIFQNSVIYGNPGDGFQLSGSSYQETITLINTVIAKNAGIGIDETAAVIPANTIYLNYNGLFSNTGGNYHQVTSGTNDVCDTGCANNTLTVDPFTNGAGNVFTLNSTAGGGPELKAAGFPGALLIGGTGNLDIGALQSAGGSSSVTVGTPIVQ